ncbi:hypothetical protein TIFTF001_009589 [Ficus carica]|uniref:Uncharacterized protein n=1 Tax=Ficus carica TaxID=3494 RepID=A0AA87ZV52_FICCA|nr:hypothetical protein TIFTF001_009589 [Ficus carica]
MGPRMGSTTGSGPGPHDKGPSTKMGINISPVDCTSYAVNEAALAVCSLRTLVMNRWTARGDIVFRRPLKPRALTGEDESVLRKA